MRSWPGVPSNGGRHRALWSSSSRSHRWMRDHPSTSLHRVRVVLRSFHHFGAQASFERSLTVTNLSRWLVLCASFALGCSGERTPRDERVVDAGAADAGAMQDGAAHDGGDDADDAAPAVFNPSIECFDLPPAHRSRCHVAPTQTGGSLFVSPCSASAVTAVAALSS